MLGSIHNYIIEWLKRHSSARRSQGHCSPVPATVRTVGTIPPIFLETHDEFISGVDETVGELIKASARHDDGSFIFEPDVIIGTLGASASTSSRQDEEVGLHVCCGAQVLGGTFDLRAGGIWLGEGVVVDPGVHIAGPAIIGRRTHLRPGAYIRGDVLIGDGVVLRGELKNTIIMDCAELGHPGYAGDSIIGWKGHFGCQSLTANLGLFGAELSLSLPGEAGNAASQYRLGRRKVGVVLGDCSQLGCATVTDPGTFLGPRTHVYPLTRLAAGVYGPDEIVKNRPEQSGAIVREVLRPPARA